MSGALHVCASDECMHVFITGGSEGLGLEVAKAFASKSTAEEPIRITLFSRTESKLNKAKTEVMKEGNVDVQIKTGDVSKVEDVRKATADSRVDIFVASAGLSIPKYFKDLTTEDFERLNNVNYMGVVNSARAFLENREAHTYPMTGHFCAISSIAASVPFCGYAAYSPTKVAVRAFIDVVRNELASDPATYMHLYFPPDTDTPGFAKENETKPLACKAMWPDAFNETFSSQSVASALVTALTAARKTCSVRLTNKNGKDESYYHIESPDFFGNLLVSRGWGHYPKAWGMFLIELFFSPLFVLLHSLMIWWMDSKVAKVNGKKDK